MESLDLSSWERERCCAFTGHRPGKLPSGYRQSPAACAPLSAALRRAILQAGRDGCDTFLSGMALGSDTLAAEEVLALKAEGRPFRLIAVIPCPEQDARWKEPDRERYRALLARADGRICVCPQYTPSCMHIRNRWLVEHARRLIAVFDGSPGGTANTVRLAAKMHREIVQISPSAPDAFLI